MKLYSKRWIIETYFRCIGTFKAFMNSISPQLRFLFFGLAVFLDLLWVFYSTSLNRWLEDSPKKSHSEKSIPIKQVDALQLTARKFLRLLRQVIPSLLAFQGGDAGRLKFQQYLL